ncbi:MAG: DUF427 domain-containing protein [Pseudomonadota bacterium]
MADITIRRAPGTWVVRAAGAVIGESAECLELLEDELKPVVYFPREDLGMAFLEASPKRTHCPWKGDAEHFHIAGKSGMIEDAAWSYPEPSDDVARIAGYVAFYPSKVTVEQL